MRMSAADFRRMVKKSKLKNGLLVDVKKEPKYHNKRCEYNGIKFDSQREKDRYIFLKECERRGEIKNLRCHVEYVLFPDEYEEVVVHLKTKDKKVKKKVYDGVKYTPDFMYEKDGKTIVEDVKGDKKAISRDFSLRVKMMHYILGIEVKTVYKPAEPV